MFVNGDLSCTELRFCILHVMHMFDTSVEDNHVHTLVKTVAECFARVRLHHLGKCETEKAVGTNVRKKLTKLILFKHQ